MFSDVDNYVKKGDLNWNGKNLEIKGTGGRLGQQAGRDISALSGPISKYAKAEAQLQVGAKRKRNSSGKYG